MVGKADWGLVREWQVGDLSETCVLDYWVGSGGLMGSGGKWSRFCRNTVEQKDSLPCWSCFLPKVQA